MTTASQSTTTEPCVFADNRLKFLCGGVDWLELSSPHMLCTDVLDALRNVQFQAKGQEQGVLCDIPVEVMRGGLIERAVVTVEVAPYSIGKGFAYTFRTDELIIHARSEPCKLETMPNLLVKFTNEALHSKDWREAYEDAETLLNALCSRKPNEPLIELTISRVDLYVDSQGLDLSQIGMEQWVGQPRAQIAQFRAGSKHTGFAVTPTMKVEDEWALASGVKRKNKGAKDEGLYVGRSGGIRFRIYDKCQEIAASSGKVWMYDKWAACEDFQAETVKGKLRAAVPVIRCEWQLRREKLNEFNGPTLRRGIRTVAQLDENLPALWAYLAGDSVTIRDRNGRTVERPGWIRLTRPKWSRTGGHTRVTTWPESDLWQQIREWGAEGFKPMRRTPLVSIRKAESLYPQAAGVAASVAARHAIIGDMDPSEAVKHFASPDAWDDAIERKSGVETNRPDHYRVDRAAGRILSRIDAYRLDGEPVPPDPQLARAVELVLRAMREDGRNLIKPEDGQRLLTEAFNVNNAGPRAEHRAQVGKITKQEDL